MKLCARAALALEQDEGDQRQRRDRD